MVPKEFRDKLQLIEGVEVIVRLEGDELRISTRAAALKRAQATLAALKKPGESVVDEFIADREKETAGE